MFGLKQKNQYRSHINKFFAINSDFKSLTVEDMIRMFQEDGESEMLKKFVNSNVKVEGSSYKLAEAQNMCKALIEHFG